MSIIHDALKKAQQGLAAKPETSPSMETPIHNSPFDEPTPIQPPIASIEPPKTPIKRMNSNQPLLLCLSGIIIIGASYFIYQQLKTFPQLQEWQSNIYSSLLHLKRESTIPSHPIKPKPITTVAKPLAQITLTNSTPSPATAPVETSLESKPISPPVTLNVNGIMANGNSNIALINNKVYQEGDEIQGVKILRISLTEIVISTNGKEERIQVGK